MAQWVGDTWRLKAGPQPDPAPNNKIPDDPTAEVDPELRRQGYKESFVQEYDGIKVYHHQGRSARKFTLGLSTNTVCIPSCCIFSPHQGRATATISSRFGCMELSCHHQRTLSPMLQCCHFQHRGLGRYRAPAQLES